VTAPEVALEVGQLLLGAGAAPVVRPTAATAELALLSDSPAPLILGAQGDILAYRWSAAAAPAARARVLAAAVPVSRPLHLPDGLSRHEVVPAGPGVRWHARPGLTPGELVIPAGSAVVLGHPHHGDLILSGGSAAPAVWLLRSQATVSGASRHPDLGEQID
jgi:hypothetical protein